MTLRQAEIILAAVIAARASGYMFSKILLESMGPFTLMGLRFLFAFFLLAVVFHKHFKNINLPTVLAGCAMGLGFFFTMACELGALVFTTSANVSFLENIAIVLVPLAGALIARKVPRPATIVCALLALAGVGLLTLSSGIGGIGLGEILGIVSAFFYAAAMLITARFSKSGDTLLMGILQIGLIGLLGMVFGFAFEAPVLPATPTEWGCLAFLVLVCTGFGFTLQPMLQRHVPANQVGMMCSLNPFVAAVLGVVVLNESIGTQGLIGAAFILVAIVVSSLWGEKTKEQENELKERKSDAKQGFGRFGTRLRLQGSHD